MHAYFAPIATPEQADIAHRLDQKITIDGDCWRYDGALSWNGYPIICVRGKKVARAHRVAYQIAIGPIPDGLHIDHVWEAGCRHRDCVNPAHLEATSQGENNRRAAAKRRALKAAAMVGAATVLTLGAALPAAATENEETVEVGFYIYPLLDASQPVGWGNSGVQTFLGSQPGGDWFTTLPGQLPAEVCGDGWGFQQDRVTHTLLAYPWPANLYPTEGALPRDGMIGNPVGHHGLLTSIVDVPPCTPPITDATPVVPNVTPGTGTCVDGAWSETLSVLTFTDAPNIRYSIDGVSYSPNPGPLTLTGSETLIYAQTAEGPYNLTAPAPWRVENGTALYVAVPIALTPEDCTPTPEPTPEPEPTDTPVPQPAPTAVPQAVEADAASAPSTRAASATYPQITRHPETGPAEDATVVLIVLGSIAVIAGTALTIGRRKQGKR